MSTSAPAWAPPLPEASGFEHLVVETPGLHTHLAVIGEAANRSYCYTDSPDWWQWHAIAPLIAARGYRVICPDLRGAGWSVADDPRVERETRLRDLLALLDVIGIERAHFVSHDMGVYHRDATDLRPTPSGCVIWGAALRAAGILIVQPEDAPGLPTPALRSSGIARARHCAERSPRGMSPARCRMQPSKPTSLRCADPTSTPRCVRSTRGMVLPEAMLHGTRRLPPPAAHGADPRRLRPPRVRVFHRGACGDASACNPERYADRVEFAYVDDAAHFITDDAPAAVADLSLDWFERAA